MTELHLSRNLRAAQLKTWSKSMLIEAHLALEDQLAEAKAELATGYAQLKAIGIERMTEQLYEAEVRPRIRNPEWSVDEYLEHYPQCAWERVGRTEDGQVWRMRPLQETLRW